MDGVYCELDEMEVGKLAKELHAMSDEICGIRKLYHEAQSSLHRTELFLNQISSSNEKIRAEHIEKILRLEYENKDLALSSDEAFTRIKDLEKNTAANSEEISGLKRLISIIQMNSEVQKNASVDRKERDEYALKLEEEIRTLKWKNEQFVHLLEAHKKQQALFEEWQREKSSLLDEIETMKIELQKSECELETVKLNLRENEEERARLLVAVNDKDAQIVNLEQHISMLKSVILVKSEASEMFNQEDSLAEREVTYVDANNTLGKDNEMLISSIKERDNKILLQEEFESLNQSFKRAMMDAMLSQKMLVEERLGQEMNFQEKSLVQSDETKKSEMQELRSQLENETRLFENLFQELESHKHMLLADRRDEKINRENFLAQLENMCQQIGFLCSEDVELMAMLGKISSARNLLSSDGPPHPNRAQYQFYQDS